jgi:hypothetical protein
MQYKLLFIKTHPSHKIAGVGMGGCVMMVFSMLSNMTNDDTLYVDMETEECMCTDPTIDIKNGWEYYFTQRIPDPAKEIITRTIQETGKINFRYDDKTIGQDLTLYSTWRNRFYNNFQIKPNLQSLIDYSYSNLLNGKITLGVQIRLTDQVYHHKTKGVTESISKVRDILRDNPSIEQIFLATDDSLIIPIVEESLPLPVVYHEGIFRADKTNRLLDPHDKLYCDRPMHRYLMSLECLWDIFTLTKCDYLLKADVSAMSIVACLLAENIKKVYWL